MLVSGKEAADELAASGVGGRPRADGMSDEAAGEHAAAGFEEDVCVRPQQRRGGCRPEVTGPSEGAAGGVEEGVGVRPAAAERTAVGI